MIKIKKYVHSCVIQDGPSAGNEYEREVDACDYEFGELCPECSEQLATTEELLAHIYRELTK
jgi:hypothetical protein